MKITTFIKSLVAVQYRPLIWAMNSWQNNTKKEAGIHGQEALLERET